MAQRASTVQVACAWFVKDIALYRAAQTQVDVHVWTAVTKFRAWNENEFNPHAGACTGSRLSQPQVCLAVVMLKDSDPGTK